jgi:surface polysaccharide O-acyltransferase-like enzyme
MFNDFNALSHAVAFITYGLLGSALPNDGSVQKIKQALAVAVVGLLVILLLASVAEYFGINHLLTGKTKIMGQLALSVIGLLLIDSPPLPERVIRILADLVESNSGAIWLQDEQNRYQLFDDQRDRLIVW